MDNKPQPVALKLAEMLPANEWLGHLTLVSYARECVAELLTQHARITELESQLAQRFDAADMATAAAQEVVQDDLITIRRPTTRAEMLWLLKLAHLVISDVDKTLEETFAPAQPAVQQAHYEEQPDGTTIPIDPSEMAPQQGLAYAALPTSNYAGRVYEEGFLVGTCPLYTADKLRAFADATHALRASHGQASSQAGEYPALVCDYCGALTPDPWHSSGMLHGKMSKHIHSCDACAARGQAPAKPDPAYSAACNLATALFKKHFAHLPDFASGQAAWILCDSTAGVISQINNMVARLVQPPTISPQADSVLEDAERYRWLRRWKGQEHEPPFTVQHEIDGTLWGGDLDAAIDTARKQGANHD